jgi:putative MATE family efflux protein
MLKRKSDSLGKKKRRKIMEEKTKPQARTRDLGKGSIPKLLAQLAIPVVVAQIVNLLYNIVDRIYIGHIPGIGAAALTGVGLFAPLLMLINAFAMLSGSGGAPRAAIFMGKKDNETAEKIMANCFSLILIFAVGLTVSFSIFAPKLLRLFGASDATLPYAVEYARIYIFGSIFVLIVLGMNLFITTQGFTKISMMTTLIGAIINVILDPIFIFVLDMGVRGAAIATVLSQAVGAIWVLRFLTGEKTILKLKLSNMKLDPKVFGPCLALGISSFVMISTESLLSISFTSSLSRYGGDVAVGAMTIITSVNQLITMPLQGICQGGQPIISYNFGAGNKDRVKKAFFTQFCVCATFTIAGWLVMMIAPWLFAGLFTSDTNLADYTSWALRIYMAGMFSMGFQVGCQQSFMALGQAKVSLLLACLRKIILLIPLIFILPCFLADKVFAVFLAEPISDILAATVTTITFFMRFDKILEVGVQVKKGD